MRRYVALVVVLGKNPMLDGMTLQVDLPASRRKQAVQRLREVFKDKIVVTRLEACKREKVTA